MGAESLNYLANNIRYIRAIPSLGTAGSQAT